MTKISAPRPLTCWVISDGRRGIENQALGLAEALGRLTSLTITPYILSGSKLFKALPPLVQVNLKRTPEAYGLQTTPPSLVVGCGRQAIAPLLAIKKAFGPETFTAYVQDPRINPKLFNCVITPEHDGITGPNIETMIGSPNRLTKKKFEEALAEFKVELAALPTKRIAVLIGGSSKHYALNKRMAQKHIKAVTDLARAGYGVMVSMSRRTPEPIVALYKESLAKTPNIWIYAGTGKNPYFAFIAAADAVLATEESTNMLTEACATGRPVFTLPMAKINNNKTSKFAALHAQLSERCQLNPYKNIEDLTMHLIAPAQCMPLNETERVAKRLLQRLKLTKTM